MTAPPAAIHVTHFAGTALSGPQPDRREMTGAWSVAARVSAIESTVPGGFERVGSMARLVVGPDTGQVVSPSARLIYSTLIRSLGPNDDLESALGTPRTVRLLQSTTAVLARGTTASIDVALPDDASLTPSYARRGVRVQLYRRAADEAYDIAIVSDDLVNVTPGSASAERTRELIVVERELTDHADRLALAIPMAWPTSTAKTVVIELSVHATTADAETIAEAQQQVDQSAAAVSALRATALPTQEELALGRSLESVGAAGAAPRGVLAFLAERSGADLAHAVSLVADDRLLEVIAGSVRARLAQMPARDRRSIAWLLDRATIDAIVSVKEEDAPKILPPIRGALSIYAGEVGRQFDVLKSLAGEATSSEDLYKRIIAEHVILLEESSPGLRVRAYEWLHTIGQAPPGYDPLASPQLRRAALEHARDRSATTQPTTTASLTTP